MLPLASHLAAAAIAEHRRDASCHATVIRSLSFSLSLSLFRFLVQYGERSRGGDDEDEAEYGTCIPVRTTCLEPVCCWKEKLKSVIGLLVLSLAVFLIFFLNFNSDVIINKSPLQ